MIETVFSVELPVREHLRVQKNRIVGAQLAKAAANEADDDQTGDNEEPPQIGAADPV